jgi:glutathione S-transferase
MITLYGFAISNYYNKVKLALLEKEIPFREVQVRPSQDEAVLQRSPLGKIPFLQTGDGFLSESQAIFEYLEDAYPQRPLYPADAFQRAKCRELIQHLELNVELIARRLYSEAFFGGTVSGETKQEVRQKVEAGLKGLTRLSSFSPYVLGEAFTVADLAAYVHLRLVARATESIYGEDLVAKLAPGADGHLQNLESRPAVRKVAVDRDAALAAFLKRD